MLWSKLMNLTFPYDDQLSWLLKVPYDFGDLGAKAKGGHVVNTNHRRVVETWMDPEHKEYFYTRVPLARFSIIDLMMDRRHPPLYLQVP